MFRDRSRWLDGPCCLALLLVAAFTPALDAQQIYTWEQLREKFRMNNPSLRAGQLSIEESRAQEITAYLRPNPDFTLATDGTQIAPHEGVWQPFSGTQFSGSVSYLRERRHKRDLRLESAQKATAISASQQADLERTLLFNLRNAFVQTLQAKAVLAVAKENLAQYDRVIQLNRDRKQAGDIAQVDLDRIELQRVQFEADLQTADVNLRTAKINVLTLLNDRTPVDQFDVTGTFDFNDQLVPLDGYRRMALENRPDLKAAMQAVEKAQTDYRLAVANGSTDPTFSAWLTHNPSFANPFAYNTLGASVTIPLRVFDKNQGEKLRTEIDVRRNQRLRDASESQVFSDVDSAYATLNNTVTLLRPYKQRYLAQATRVRDTISFSYQRGGASLLDFLQAQQEYRAIQVTYLNLVGSYLTAASQLSLAVGREVIQ